MFELEQIIEGLKIGEDFKFGEPWRLSEKSITVVVPILGKEAAERNYRILQEVKDQVDITDTGSIGRAKVKNRSGGNVFIRKGTLLEGLTQSRGVVIGTVIPPQVTVDLEIQCVYATRGIRSGASFNVAEEIVPPPVERSFIARRSQVATWSAVGRYSLQAMSSPQMSSVGTPRILEVPQQDNLIGVMRHVKRFRVDVERNLEKIPGDLVNQVGIAIIDLSGILGVEFFDHPDSWRAFSESIIRNYSDLLTREQETQLFELKMENIGPAILSFLEKLAHAKKTVVVENEVSKTLALDGEGQVGELTLLEGRVIHFIGTRRDGTKEPAPRGTPSVVRSAVDAWNRRTSQEPRRTRGWYTNENVPVFDWRDSTPEHYEERRREYMDRKGSFDLLNRVREDPKTWKNLETNLDVSTRTLSKRLKEAEDLGLVTQERRASNGRQVYGLTGQGWKALKRRRENE